MINFERPRPFIRQVESFVLNLFSFHKLLINYKIKIDPKVEIQRIQLDTRALLTIKDNSSFQSGVIEIILRLNLNFP